MTITAVNPEGLQQVEIYRQVAVTTGARQVFVAGQVARDAEGGAVGPGDLAAQAEQAYVNVGAALAGVGGSLADLAKLTVYVVGWTPDKMPLLIEGLTRAAARLGAEVMPLPPSTLIGVAALAEDDLLVEIEAIAVLD